MKQYVEFICSILRGEPVVWPSSTDWLTGDFIQTCGKNGVTSLVYYLLHKSCEREQLPEELREKLKKHVLQVSAFELGRTNELTSVLDACARDKIYPLLLKGAGISYTHYPSPGLRERCDTDLFLQFDDIEPFCRVVTELDYSVAYPIYKSHQLTCVRSNISNLDSLDVHWRISNSSRFARILSYDEVFERSIPVPGVPSARTLRNEDALLLACVHLDANSEHDAGRLIWLYDVYLLVASMQSGGLATFARLAVEKQVQDVCFDVLKRSRDCFPIELTDEAFQLLSTPLQKISFYNHFKQSNLGLLLDDFIVLPSLRQKLALFKELFFPPQECLLSQYGKSGVLWLPWLYFRHILGGMFKRLMLR